MATQILEFPFDSGAYEAADFTWLPPNLFQVVENMRLDLDGRLAVRPGNTQLANTTYSANTLTAYDLVNFNGRLVALGDQCALGRPTDVFEYVNATPAAWRASSGDRTSLTTAAGRLPRATDVRELGRVPDLSSTVDNVSVAAGNGFVCSVSNQVDLSVCIHVFNPTTDQTIFLETRTGLDTARVVFANGAFWICAKSGTTIVAIRFRPLVDEDTSGTFTLATGVSATGATDLAAAATGSTDFCVVWAVGTRVDVVRASGTGGVLATWNVTTVDDARAVGVCGNAGATLVSVIRQRGADGTYRLDTYNASTGALTTGPTTLFAGAAGTTYARAGIAQDGTSVLCLGFIDRTTGSTKDTVTQIANEATHALGGTANFADALPTTIPLVVANSDYFFGAVNTLAAITGTPKGTNSLIERSPAVPCVMKDGIIAGRQGFRNDVCGLAIDSGRTYWGNLVLGDGTNNVFQVTEVLLSSTARRQMAVVANELHVAGGLPSVYDGRLMVEHGFAERPVVQATANAGGSLTLLGTYSVRVTWEVVDARGNILRSQASDVVTTTLTGVQRQLDVVATTPHSLRMSGLRTDTSLAVRVCFYRTIAGGSNFILDTIVRLSSSVDMGVPTTSTLSRTDAQLVAGGVILYEQSQTPLSHVAPQPYRFTWPARERQLIGGLPAPETFQFSKLLFPGEPVEFASPGRLGFFGRANKDLTAVGAFETVGIAWTADEILLIPGRGPEHNGTGEFDATQGVPSPGGCSDWRSLVSAPPGFMFQMLGEKLMLLSRGGEVSWIGQPVRQTLASFPVITGAVHIRSQMAVVFSCTDTGGTAGRLLVYDLRRQVWYVDTVGPVSAVSELTGRLAYVLGGNVFLQDAAAGSGTFPGAAVQTGFIPVTDRLGWGQIHKLGLILLDAGACSVQCLIDADDGTGLRDLGTQALTATGRRLELFWSIPTAVRKLARFSARFVLTSGSPSVGAKLIAWAAEVQGSPNMVRVGSGGVVQ